MDAVELAVTMSLLDRDPSPQDLEAERDLPRPGVWAGEQGADLRALTQDETDMLVRAELYSMAVSTERAAFASACGGQPGMAQLEDRNPSRVSGGQCLTTHVLARMQRGGIDSDPLVRVLARRAWGDRDRRWFELRGVRKGEAVAKMMSGAVALAWPGDRTRNSDIVAGRAMDDARPGEEVDVVGVGVGPIGVGTCMVGDRLREPPADLEVDSTGDLHPRWRTFEQMISETRRMDAMVTLEIDRVISTRYVTLTATPLDMARDVLSDLMRKETTVERPRGPVQDKPPIPPWAKKRRERSRTTGR